MGFFRRRRIIFVLAAIAFEKYPVGQIMMLIAPTIAIIIFIGQEEPLANKMSNRIDIYNNYFIVVVGYCLLCFTDFVPDPQARYTIGYGLIIITLGNVIVNLLIVS